MTEFVDTVVAYEISLQSEVLMKHFFARSLLGLRLVFYSICIIAILVYYHILWLLSA
jgi:hypothetical protein